MPQKPIVVLLINSLQGGGGERSVLTLAQGFIEIGCEVHVVRFKPKVEYYLNEDIKYHLVSYSAGYKMIVNESFRYYFFAKKVDAYILKKIGRPALVLSNLIRADSVLYHTELYPAAHIIRNTLSKEYALAKVRNKNKLVKRFQKIYSNHPCVCVSKGVELDLQDTLGHAVTTTTIYNAFDQPAIQEMAQDFEPEYTNYILHVGKFKYAKAHDVLIRAYAKSSRRYPLLLLGQGKLKPQMEALAGSLGLQDEVHFLGFKKNPYPYMKHAKFSVLSSRFEGFVRVVAESLALGTPVISTDCPSGPNELLPKNNLVPVDDVNALAQKMDEAMQNPAAFYVPFDKKFLPSNVARQFVEYMQLDKQLFTFDNSDSEISV